MGEQHCVIYCTCPDKRTAEQIANKLIDERLAACINIVEGITSVYRWEDQRQSDAELLLIVKSRSDIFPSLEKRILELHPYAVPEIIALPIVQGTAAYLSWIDACLG